MSTLAALQKEMKRLLFVSEKPTGRSPLWGTTLPARLDVYRNNVQKNWTDTLNTDFPLTRKQFSETAWDALVQRFFSQHPPRVWELNASMEPFVPFLKKEKVSAPVQELAEYEWTDLKTFIHPAAPNPGLGITNPTASIRVYRYSLFDWVESGAPAKRPPKKKPEVLVFYRDAENTLHIQEADPLMLLMMDFFKSPGRSLSKLEALRKRILPANRVPLREALKRLHEIMLIV